MMGMGFLKLNKVLGKHKWDAEEPIKNEEQDRRERMLFVVALIVVLGILAVVVYFAW
jgi:hypothetical protein